MLADVVAGGSRVPPMCSLRRLATKTLVWLAVVLIPFQSLPVAACCCAGVDERQRVDAEMQPGHLGSRCGCCDRIATTQAAGTRGEDKPCCQRAGPSPRSSCCGRSLACTCSCQENNSSPAVPPALTETRCRSVVDLLQLPAPVCLNLEKSRPRSVEQRPAFYTSASECCISLCRFLL